MTAGLHVLQRSKGIAFLGNYLPRACGIATFTYDLSNAVAHVAGDDQRVFVAAMNDRPEGYLYPDRVKFELRQDYLVDYSRAADFLNFSQADVVSLQHEYGIYGGECGSNVLTFLRDLNRPAVVTCHTVMENPEPLQREVLREIASQAEKLVVMSRRAYGFLEDVYDIPEQKIAFIPHGIHDTPFIDPNYYKDKFGVEGRRVLLTFGLLTPNKGVEYVIEALPEIVAKHPKTTYVILGATHPAIVRDEGEAYRLGLQRRVRELGLEDHVLFHPRFVELEELMEYLGATDIFVTPYLFLDQIAPSGVLAYATGAGKAVVSTPYWHAEELLDDGRGCLVPPSDSSAIAKAVNGLLGDEVELSAMRKRAYNHCRGMVWSAVARNYMDLFDEVRSHVPVSFPTASSLRTHLSPTSLPMPKIDHLLRLSDDTGPARHARHSIPDWTYGYSLEDAAATLVASIKFHDIYNSPEALRLAETCLTLFQTLIGENDHSKIAAGLDYSRRQQGLANQDAVGQAVWALGYLVRLGPKHLAPAAHDLFHQILPTGALDSPRAASYGILGASNYLHSYPGASEIRRFLKKQAGVLKSFLTDSEWVDAWQRTDWPVAVQAYCEAGRILDDSAIRDVSKMLVAQLRIRSIDGTAFGAHGEDRSSEESPTTAATFIEALGAAYYDTRNQELLDPIRAAVDWFLGANRQETALWTFPRAGAMMR